MNTVVYASMVLYGVRVRLESVNILFTFYWFLTEIQITNKPCLHGFVKPEFYFGHLVASFELCNTSWSTIFIFKQSVVYTSFGLKESFFLVANLF